MVQMMPFFLAYIKASFQNTAGSMLPGALNANGKLELYFSLWYTQYKLKNYI